MEGRSVRSWDRVERGRGEWKGERRAGAAGRVEWGGRKGNKSADTIAFLDEIQTCNSSKGRRGRRSSSSVSRKPATWRGRDERMVYTKVTEAKATCACEGVLKVIVR